jgi:hypothetical protein
VGLFAGFRQVLGPALVGLGAWAAAGDLSVAGPNDPAVRVAVPASLGWLAAFVAAACLVPAWRRDPTAATPALLSVLPWLPLPLPAVALLWTGPLAWLPVGLALLCAVSSKEPRFLEKPGFLHAGVLTLAAAALTAWSLAPRLPGGDEPHYLVIAQSLLKDGDLRIQNNHEARDYATYFPAELRPDFIRRGQDGAVYSIHAPGTSVLVLPAFAAFGYRGAQATVILLAAIAGALMWYAAFMATGDRRAAWVGWLAVAGTPTFLIQSVTIFPDGPGACLVAVALVFLIRLARTRDDVSRAALAGFSACLAVLPWLHSRFSILAAGLGLCAVWLLLADQGRPRFDRVRRVGVFLIVPLASALGWFSYFQILYGTPSPAAPYGSDTTTRLAHVPGGLAALLVDGQFGLLTYAPILALALVGLPVAASGRAPWIGRVVFSAGLAYVAATATYWMWWAGVPAPPARFAAAALPVLAVPVALGWQRSRPALRAVWTALLAMSVVTAGVLIGVGRGALAWNTRGIRSAWLDWLSGLADLSRGWPSFFWRLTPEDLTTEFHFGLHVVVWTVAVAVAGWGFVWLRGTASPDRRHALAAAWWIPLTLTCLVQTGWWINGSSGIAAASSQLQVLDRIQSRDRALEVGPGSVRRLPASGVRITIRATRADRVGEAGASWQPLLNVASGRYEVTLSSRRPKGGVLTFRLGRSTAALKTFQLAPTSLQKLALWLPAGAAALFIEPDSTAAASLETLEISPVRLGSRASDAAATSAPYGDTDVFFHDSGATFVENEGFWIRGGSTARFTVAQPDGRSSITLQLTNGAAANDVALEWGGTTTRLPLAPSESRAIAVPLSADGAVEVRLTSPSGFRPSEVGPSRDTRYLGVRVEITGQGDGR